MDAKLRKEFNDAYLELGGMGERVLGFCDYRLDAVEYPRGFEVGLLLCIAKKEFTQI